MDYARFFAKATRRQRKNFVRKMANLYMKNPNCITLAAGMPNASTFPIEEITITYKSGITKKLKDRELFTSLQYSSSHGNALLLEKMRAFQKTRHAPRRQDWDVIFTVGAQDALFKIFRLFLDEGEPMMAQTPMYAGVLGTSILLGRSEKAKIQLGEGKNNPITIPFEEITILLKDSKKLVFNKNDISNAFNLGKASGCDPFVMKLREVQREYFSPPRNDWDILPVTGAQDGMDRIFQAIINEGDAVMIQSPPYFGVWGTLSPLNPDFIEIQQDADGIIPEEIVEVCEERRNSGRQMPKLLYINPVGTNPTGSCLSEERKIRVYELARKYDFLILEDDPYYFIHFLDKQPSSLLSIDIDGRVIRLDSFSKILSAGIRLGVVTAHREIIKMLEVHVENSILHTSSLSQMVVYKLFESWTPERFDEHFKQIQDFYRSKRDIMITSIEKHLTGLAEWSVPKGGMFVWIKVKGIDNIMDLVMDKCIANGVFVLPGNAFNYDATKPSQHLRLCYSYASPEEIDKGLAIVAKLIREEISKQESITNGHQV